MVKRAAGIAAAATVVVLAALALGWRGDAVSIAQGPTTLTIYSSLPLHGDSRAQSADVVRAEKLALADAGGRAGGFQIHFLSLDDSTDISGRWDPGQVSANARKASTDPATIAYLGE